MSVSPFHLNRPVHLARRDVFYEQAEQLIEQLPTRKKLPDQQEVAEKALRLFYTARQHAQAANRSEKTSAEDQFFLDFLNTAVDNTQSITRMLRRQRSVESEDCPLGRFLGSEDVGSKMSAHYRRCAAHILKGLLQVLEQAAQPYQELQQTGLTKMSPTDQLRYEKARTHLTQLPDA
ncbi:MAG: hypothetical protein ISR85_05885 [Kiritimatiellales bacterium]|nr:hypothetical protein [Kiritimatiellota bacterium]MBL7012441.1 hypothetical protein [Kiritimatiellales bacterium]